VGNGIAVIEVSEAAVVLISANAASGEVDLDGPRPPEADSSGFVSAPRNRPK
jgi:hypothetical protein